MKWETVGFEDGVSSRGSGTAGLPQGQWEAGGKHPVIGQGAEAIEGWSNRTELLLTPNPAVVLYGGHTRRAKYVDHPFVPGPNVKILEPKERLDAKFLFYFLAQLPIESRGYADHFPEVRRSSIPVPPLAEQRRIAEVLDRAEALRAKRRAALAQFDSLTESLFRDLFGDLTKCKLVPLEFLASAKRHALSSGPFGSSLTSKHYVDEGILVLRGLNVTGGEITLEDCKFISKTKAQELSRSLVAPMDIVIVAVGASGFACLIPNDFPPAVMSQNFNKVSPNLDIVDPVYLVFLLNSSFIQRQFFQNITDTVRTFLSLTKIKKVSVPLPPITLQREFARRVTAVERLKTAHRASLAELDALFATLQHRAFRGEL